MYPSRLQQAAPAAPPPAAPVDPSDGPARSDREIFSYLYHTGLTLTSYISFGFVSRARRRGALLATIAAGNDPQNTLPAARAPHTNT